MKVTVFVIPWNLRLSFKLNYADLSIKQPNLIITITK